MLACLDLLLPLPGLVRVVRFDQTLVKRLLATLLEVELLLARFVVGLLFLRDQEAIL